MAPGSELLRFVVPGPLARLLVAGAVADPGWVRALGDLALVIH